MATIEAQARLRPFQERQAADVSAHLAEVSLSVAPAAPRPGSLPSPLLQLGFQPTRDALAAPAEGFGRSPEDDDASSDATPARRPMSEAGTHFTTTAMKEPSKCKGQQCVRRSFGGLTPLSPISEAKRAHVGQHLLRHNVLSAEQTLMGNVYFRPKMPHPPGLSVTLWDFLVVPINPDRFDVDDGKDAWWTIVPGSIVLMADESAPRKDAAPASKERVIAIAGSGSNFRLILVPVDEQMRAVQGHTYREIKSRMLCLFCNKVDNKDVQFGSTSPTYEFSLPEQRCLAAFKSDHRSNMPAGDVSQDGLVHSALQHRQMQTKIAELERELKKAKDQAAQAQQRLEQAERRERKAKKRAVEAERQAAEAQRRGRRRPSRERTHGTKRARGQSAIVVAHDDGQDGLSSLQCYQKGLQDGQKMIQEATMAALRHEEAARLAAQQTELAVEAAKREASEGLARAQEHTTESLLALLEKKAKRHH